MIRIFVNYLRALRLRTLGVWIIFGFYLHRLNRVGLQLTVTENFSPRINTNWHEYREKISEIRAIRGKFGPVTTNHGLMQSYRLNSYRIRNKN